MQVYVIIAKPYYSEWGLYPNYNIQIGILEFLIF